MDQEYFTTQQPESPQLSLEVGENPGIPLSPSITTRLFYLALTIDRYYTPALFLFGTIGNGLSIIVFFSKSHNARGSLSSSVYLSALAISDTGFLLNIFIMWLDNLGTSLLTNSFICKTVMYTSQVYSFTSVWFIVVFTIERFFAVCYPLFRPSTCTASRAKKIAACLTLFAAVGFSYVLVIADVQSFHLFNHRINSRESTGESSNSTLTSTEIENVATHESMFEASNLPSSHETQPWSDLEDRNFPDGADIAFLSDTQLTVEDKSERHGGPVSSSGSRKAWKGAIPTENPTSTHPDKEDPPEFAYMCSVAEEYHGISRVYSYIDSVLTFFVPFVLIAFLNLKIILCVKKIKGHRESMLATTKIFRRPKPQHHPVSGMVEEKGKLRDFLNKFHYIKKPAGPLSTGGAYKKPRNAINCQQKHQQEESNASCSNTQNLRYPPQLEDDNNLNAEVMQGLLEKAPSIESDDQSSPGPVTPPNFKPMTNPVNQNATEIRVTKTLLLVSSVFLLLHLPSHCIRVAAFILSIGTDAESKKETFQQLNVAQHWANILFNTNFAINFLLYCCSGKAFRRSIRNLFTKDFLLSRRNPNRSPRNASTTVLTSQLTLQPDSVSTSCKFSTTRSQRNHAILNGLEEDQL